MTQGEDGTRVEERIGETFGGAAAMHGYRIAEWLESPCGSILVRVQSAEDPEDTMVVDVKPMRRLRWDDADVQEDYVWIEVHGLAQASPGWLTEGEATHIAFERHGDFVLVPRGLLRRLVRRGGIVDHTKSVSTVLEAIGGNILVRDHRYDTWTILELATILEHETIKDTFAVWDKLLDVGSQ